MLFDAKFKIKNKFFVINIKIKLKNELNPNKNKKTPFPNALGYYEIEISLSSTSVDEEILKLLTLFQTFRTPKRQIFVFYIKIKHIFYYR